MHDIGLCLKQGKELFQTAVWIRDERGIRSGKIGAGVDTRFDILDSDDISLAHHQSAAGEYRPYISLSDDIQFFQCIACLADELPVFNSYDCHNTSDMT